MQAERVTEKIAIEVQKLSEYPQLGRPVTLTKRVTIRQILVFKYRIFYRELNDRIDIISIYHSSRLLKNNPGLQSFFEEE